MRSEQEATTETMTTGVELFASAEGFLDEIEQSWESEEWLSDGFGGWSGTSLAGCHTQQDCNSQNC